MKIYFLPMLLSLFFLGACDKNDEIIPEDADENFITSVVMTVDGKSYTADITDNTVTITVPYTVSLNKRRSGIQVHKLLQQSYLILKR